VPVVENRNIAQTINTVLDLVLESVEARQGIAAGR